MRYRIVIGKKFWLNHAYIETFVNAYKTHFVN